MSHIICNFVVFFDKVVKLIVGGSVINGATPSSFKANVIFVLIHLLSNHLEMICASPNPQKL